MKKFEDAVSNSSNAFPATVSNNASGALATDGTEWIKSLIDEWWGGDQALVNHAGITPSGTTDSATGTGDTGTSAASDRLVAIQKVGGTPPGTVVAWMGFVTQPDLSAGGNGRLLALTGQAVAIADYPDLVSACYIGDANNSDSAYEAFYKVTSASVLTRNTSGTHFVLPDLRGYFLRGLDTTGTVDLDGAGRTIASVQTDKTGDHTHTELYDSVANGPFKSEQISYTTGSTTIRIFTTGGALDARVTGITGTDENRPKNRACRWCIVY